MKYAVIGTQFGDEGKGLTVDYLCSKSNNPLVVRYSGGQQAGHTVYHNGIQHTFSNFGSGTLRGVPTFWMGYCTFDPCGVVREYKKLSSNGINPILYVDRNCPITTPLDIFRNRNSIAAKHGSCGQGVGSTKQREEDFYSLTFSDVFSETILSIKIDLIKQYYGVDLQDELWTEFIDAINYIKENKNITINDECIINSWCGDVIFESSQGLLLDQNIGFFPHVTRSNTSTKNIKCYGPEVFYITRAYQTRHGNGPMTNFELPHNIKDNPNETNVTNEFQGAFKKSLLDLDLLLYGIGKDNYNLNKVNLVITCLDHIENEYRFTHNREIVNCKDEREFVERISNILDIKSVLLSRSPYSELIEKFI